MINWSLIEYTMIKYEPRLLAAGALYLAYTIEKKANHRNYSHNNSSYSMTSKSKDSIGIESSMKLISIL
jgi:Cyclin, C-terminal domain